MSMFITKSPGIFTPAHVRTIYNRCRIGNRDWVGFGHNGSANYKDDAHFPFPAIRFKENTRDIWALREKEKGDWKCLCCEEKKALYRSSFCQTFAEFQHPTGLWKVVLGCVLLCTSFSFWAMMFNHYYVFEPLPASLSKESQKAQLRRMLELRVNPIDGISSKWDYDNDRWKPGCEPCLVKKLMSLLMVAIVLAFIGMVAANPVAPLGYGHGYGYGSSLLLPSAVSMSSSVVNHGISVPRVAVAPIITAPVIKTVVPTVVRAPIVTNIGWGGYGLGGLGWGGYGLGGLGWGGHGLGGYGLGGYGLGGYGLGGYGLGGWGKGWH